jgi:hypothetical protein
MHIYLLYLLFVSAIIILYNKIKPVRRRGGGRRGGGRRGGGRRGGGRRGGGRRGFHPPHFEIP